MITNTHTNRELLLDTLCEVFELTKDRLTAKDRHRDVVQARAVGYKIAREKMGMTFAEIARLFCKPGKPAKHHTTIMHAIENLNGLASIGDDIAIGSVNAVLSKLNLAAKGGMSVVIEVDAEQLTKLMAILYMHDYKYTVVDGVTSLTDKN
jgi:hypothetical protein